MPNMVPLGNFYAIISDLTSKKMTPGSL